MNINASVILHNTTPQYFLAQFILTNQVAKFIEQKGKKLILSTSQFDFFAGNMHHVCIMVHYQRSRFLDIAFLFFASILKATQNRFDPRQHFSMVKRFGQVIVRTKL